MTFGYGNSYKKTLPSGWLKQAMLLWTLPLNNGQPLDLGVGGAWTPVNVSTPGQGLIFDVAHNSHMTVTLSIPSDSYFYWY